MNDDLPAINIEFDAQRQGIIIKSKGFASMRLAKAVLQMAVDEIDHQIRLERAIQMQAQQQQNAKDAALARQILKG